ncbi:hypothetical protein RCL1_003788 [Eukaryota sp. TZLM3-RCL]
MSEVSQLAAIAPSHAVADFLFDPRLNIVPFADYWSVVKHLKHPDEKERAAGMVDYPVYRALIDRPKIAIPSILRYLFLTLLAPFLMFSRKFRSIGRYQFKYDTPIYDELTRRMRRYKLDLRDRPSDNGVAKTVDVYKNGECLASNVLNPRFIYGYCSLFFATYKVPIAGILSSLTTFAVLYSFRFLNTKYQVDVLDAFPLIVYPTVVVIIHRILRDWTASIIGSIPVIVGRIIWPFITSHNVRNIVLSLAIVFVLYNFYNSFFLVRPTPPSLLFYSTEGPLKAYDNIQEDGPYWLKSRHYWVFRNLMVVSGELNSPTRKDWERVELWINADMESPNVGELEYVVSDVHYREVWIPAEKLIPQERKEIYRHKLRNAMDHGQGGCFIVEADANVIFHTPELITLTFSPTTEKLPAQRIYHLFSALFKQAVREDPSPFLLKLEKLQLEIGQELFDDVPEFLGEAVAKNMLSLPWTYWRYPFGVNSSRKAKLYGDASGFERRLKASDARLQIKAPQPDLHVD